MSKKTIGEQIADLEAMRVTKMGDMEAITSKAIEEGRTKDADERDQFNELKTEVKAIDDELQDLRDQEELNKAAATPVPKAQKTEGVRSPATIKTVEKLEPGIAFARLARVKALAKLDGESVRTVAREQYGEDSSVYALVNKAAVPAGATIEGNWADWMTGDGKVFGDFIEFLRPQTIIGRFGEGNIPSLRSVPADITIGAQTTGGEGYWVGEGKAKPLTKFEGEISKLTLLKVANIAVVTEELLRKATLAAERFLRDQLAVALASRLDTDFVNPAKAAVAGVSPASITHGIAPLAPTAGNTADAARADIQRLLGSFIAAGQAPKQGVLLMSTVAALNLSMMLNPLGQAEFAGLTMNGGVLGGLPVLVSDYIAPGTAVLVNASDIYITEEGGVQVDMSREASLEMSDAPSHNSVTPTGTQLVSLWQTNSVGFRAERFINWARRRATSVAYVTDAAWAGGDGVVGP